MSPGSIPRHESFSLAGCGGDEVGVDTDGGGGVVGEVTDEEVGGGGGLGKVHS